MFISPVAESLPTSIHHSIVSEANYGMHAQGGRPSTVHGISPKNPPLKGSNDYSSTFEVGNTNSEKSSGYTPEKEIPQNQPQEVPPYREKEIPTTPSIPSRENTRNVSSQNENFIWG